MWTSDKFVREIRREEHVVFTKKDIKFAKTPSRTSLSLINQGLFEELSNLKNNLGDKTKLLLKVFNPWDKIKNKDPYFEIFRYLETTRDYLKDPQRALYVSNSNLNSISKIYPNTNTNTNTNTKEDKNEISNKYDLIIIDNEQNEQQDFRTLLKECIMALKCQQDGGMLICKFLDTTIKPICQLISLILDHYEKCIVIKPRTSKYSSQEKFIVFVNRISYSSPDDLILEMENLLGMNNDEGEYIRDIGISIFKELTQTLYDYNNFIISNQIKYYSQIIGSVTNWTFEKQSQLEAIQNLNAQEFNALIGNPALNVCEHKLTTTHVSTTSHTLMFKKCLLCNALIMNNTK